jgi:conserved oligomeric Golgi complex subunit 3
MWKQFDIDLSILQEDPQADNAPVEGIADLLEDAEQDNGPPQATVARRAKSYSDFYDIVTAHLKKEREQERDKQKKKPREHIKTELEFAEWYDEVSHELVDASHETYQCVPTERIQRSVAS